MILTLLISQAIMPFFVSFMYPCFIVGMELKYNKSFFSRIINYRYRILTFFALMLLFWNEEAWQYSHGVPSGILQGHYTVWAKIAGFRFFRMFIGIVGALGIIAVFTIVFNRDNYENNKLIQILKDWGQYTLEVYILQAIILERTLSHFINFSNMNYLLYDIIVSPILAFAILALCIFIAKLLKTQQTIIHPH